MARLTGKYALITGGTSGIGLETARRFLQEGAQVAVTGRSPEKLAEAARQLPEAWVLEHDAGDIARQRALAKQLATRWPQLDVLFVNAGDVTHLPLEEWDEAHYDRLMDTNLKGPFFLIQALLPLLANPSSIILCGSVSSRIGLPQSSAYAASKSGLLSLARTLSGELLARGIRCNGLSPGPIHTPALENLAQANAGFFEQVNALVPLGRLGTSREVADAALFLASEESSFVVGTEVQVDGGVANL